MSAVFSAPKEEKINENGNALGVKTRLLLSHLKQKTVSKQRDAMIAAARKELYHDYRSPEVCGKRRLIEEALEAGFDDIARKTEHGDYDDPISEYQVESDEEHVLMSMLKTLIKPH
jgi:hypothetical protein